MVAPAAAAAAAATAAASPHTAGASAAVAVVSEGVPVGQEAGGGTRRRRRRRRRAPLPGGRRQHGSGGSVGLVWVKVVLQVGVAVHGAAAAAAEVVVAVVHPGDAQAPRKILERKSSRNFYCQCSTYPTRITGKMGHLPTSSDYPLSKVVRTNTVEDFSCVFGASYSSGSGSSPGAKEVPNRPTHPPSRPSLDGGQGNNDRDQSSFIFSWTPFFSYSFPLL